MSPREHWPVVAFDEDTVPGPWGGVVLGEEALTAIVGAHADARRAVAVIFSCHGDGECLVVLPDAPPFALVYDPDTDRWERRLTQTSLS